MDTVVSVKNLVKKYKNHAAVDDLSFSVKKGEILGLLGPNGSGKTTTINCILSLLDFDSGDIKIFGKSMRPDAYSIKQKIGVIFQEVAVFDELTVYENIDYFCGLYIKDKNTRKSYIKDAIKLVGLEKFEKYRPKQLSGGLLRRLNIACGIAHKPELIFLDEPTVAVDPQSRNNILNDIKKLRDHGATVIYTTHYMEEVRDADKVVILDKGHIVANDTPAGLKNKYTNTKLIWYTEQNSENEKLISDFAYRYEVDHYIVKLESQKEFNLTEFLYQNRHQITDYEIVKGSMDDVFLNLTGRKLGA